MWSIGSRYGNVDMLDPITFNFSALVIDSITLARQQETQYEWLDYHDSSTVRT
jgi:hypothetical protein